jgi:hypothetical protein
VAEYGQPFDVQAVLLGRDRQGRLEMVVVLERVGEVTDQCRGREPRPGSGGLLDRLRVPAPIGFQRDAQQDLAVGALVHLGERLQRLLDAVAGLQFSRSRVRLCEPTTHR